MSYLKIFLFIIFVFCIGCNKASVNKPINSNSTKDADTVNKDMQVFNFALNDIEFDGLDFTFKSPCSGTNRLKKRFMSEFESGKDLVSIDCKKDSLSFYINYKRHKKEITSEFEELKNKPSAIEITTNGFNTIEYIEGESSETTVEIEDSKTINSRYSAEKTKVYLLDKNRMILLNLRCDSKQNKVCMNYLNENDGKVDEYLDSVKLIKSD